jgi:hypothetical protein
VGKENNIAKVLKNNVFRCETVLKLVVPLEIAFLKRDKNKKRF